MINNLSHLKQKYSLKINGVIHVGAHYGEEYHIYKKIGIRNMIFFEASRKNFLIMEQKIGGKVKKSLLRKIFGCEKEVILVNKAVGSENKKVILNVEKNNHGLSNSLLNPKLTLDQYPHIVFNETEEVEMIKLDDFIIKKHRYNFLVADVQGYELEVLKGSEEFLKKIDYLVLEVNNKENYEGCALIEEIDQFLLLRGFENVETNWCGESWGDALYIKNSKI